MQVPAGPARKELESMAAEDEVRQASDHFYTALNRMANGDAGPMMEVWSHTSDVSTMHPIGGREVGWEQVRGPWEQVASLAADSQITLKDSQIWVVGDMAYQIGTEAGKAKFGGHSISVDQRVTNIYRREAGEWKIVHHHADLSPAMVDLLVRLQSSQG
jgi:ketosteroid isomerase-like protein